jgi:hypothetical protein
VLISIFPCYCGDAAHEIVKGVHGVSAGVMFAVLAWFCWDFIERAKTKRYDDRATAARRRIVIYSLCGIGTIVAVVLFAAHFFTKDERLVFWGETFGLVSFGISWLTASHKMPVITAPSERDSLFGFRAAPVA